MTRSLCGMSGCCFTEVLAVVLLWMRSRCCSLASVEKLPILVALKCMGAVQSYSAAMSYLGQQV